MAERYVRSVRENPPGVEHRNLIICNGRHVRAPFRKLFDTLPNCEYFLHDNTGWDIGGYLAAARIVQTTTMLCMGADSTVRKAGWLARMQEAWDKHGDGFYGALTSYQIRPHFNTTGFWCSPQTLLDYPHPVVTREDRYRFEHGKDSCWLQVKAKGKPCKLVTWCGEYDWQEWRKPPNIAIRGDQSNCLTGFRLTDSYEHFCRPEGNHLDIEAKANLEYLTDHHIVDEDFRYPTWVL